ncbi:MAG: glycoside hydrolase family 88 protein [bacterium]
MNRISVIFASLIVICLAGPATAVPPKFLPEPFAGKFDPDVIVRTMDKVAGHYRALNSTADSEGGRKVWNAGLQAVGKVPGDASLLCGAGDFGDVKGNRKKAVDLLCAWSEMAALPPGKRWFAPGFKVVTAQSNRSLCSDNDFVNACLAVHAVAWGAHQALGIMVIDYYRVPAIEGWLGILSKVGDDGRIAGDDTEPLLKAGTFLLAARQVLNLSEAMAVPQPYTREPVYFNDLKEQRAMLAQATLPSAAESRALMRRACAWQLRHLHQSREGSGSPDTSWQRAAFYVGIMAAYKATGDKYYLELAQELARKNECKPGLNAGKLHGADDLAISQVYLDLHRLTPESADLAPTREALDRSMAGTKHGQFDWSWVDALFMAPPAWARMAKISGERKYLDHMNDRWWETVDQLWNSDAGLVYRDRTYIVRPSGLQLRECNGEKIFWGRGNGWFTGALCRVLDVLPSDHPDRPQYEAILKKQMASLVKLQGDGGLWTTSLLNPDGYPMGDTSCSTFFCYGLAWAINHGLADKNTFLPPALKAWKAIASCVAEDGCLCYVQAEADSTRSPLYKKMNREYGTGALLLAGSEILQLIKQAEGEQQ